MKLQRSIGEVMAMSSQEFTRWMIFLRDLEKRPPTEADEELARLFQTEDE